jgi:hypothetical protein
MLNTKYKVWHILKYLKIYPIFIKYHKLDASGDVIITEFSLFLDLFQCKELKQSNYFIGCTYAFL